MPDGWATLRSIVPPARPETFRIWGHIPQTPYRRQGGPCTHNMTEERATSGSVPSSLRGPTKSGRGNLRLGHHPAELYTPPHQRGFCPPARPETFRIWGHIPQTPYRRQGGPCTHSMTEERATSGSVPSSLRDPTKSGRGNLRLGHHPAELYTPPPQIASLSSTSHRTSSPLARNDGNRKTECVPQPQFF